MSWLGVSCRSEFSAVEEGAPRPSRNHHPQDRLYVHLSQDAIDRPPVEHGNHLITPGQLQDWCDAADQVIVKPVLDPTAHDPVDTPVVPDRHREVIAVRDQTSSSPGAPDPPDPATPTTPSRRRAAVRPCPCNEASSAAAIIG